MADNWIESGFSMVYVLGNGYVLRIKYQFDKHRDVMGYEWNTQGIPTGKLT